MKRYGVIYYQEAICPVCKGKAIFTWEPPGLTFECSKCGYSYATSYFHPLDEDQKEYTVFIKPNNAVTKDKLMYLSSVSSKNYIYCKSLLINGGELLRGKSYEINDKIDILINKDISIDIIPEWKYFDDPIEASHEWQIKKKTNRYKY